MNLIELVGVDRMVIGSDCLAKMGYNQSVNVVERLKELSSNERDAIVEGNVADGVINSTTPE